MVDKVTPIWLELKKDYVDDNLDRLLGYLSNQVGSSDDFYKITLNLLQQRVDELLTNISGRPLYADEEKTGEIVFKVKLLGGYLLAFPEAKNRMQVMMALLYELRVVPKCSHVDGLIAVMSRCLRHKRVEWLPFSFKDLTQLSNETIGVFTYRLCQTVGGVRFAEPVELTAIFNGNGRLYQTEEGLTITAPGAWTHPETLKTLVASLPTPNGCCRFATPKGEHLKNADDIQAASIFCEGFLANQLKPFKTQKKVQLAYGDGDSMVLRITRLGEGLIEVETVDQGYKKMTGRLKFNYPYVCGLEVDKLYKFLMIGDLVNGSLIDADRGLFSIENELKRFLIDSTQEEYPVGAEMFARFKGSSGRFYNWLGENGVMITSYPVEGVKPGDIASMQITMYETGPNYGKIDTEFIAMATEEEVYQVLNEEFNDLKFRKDAVDAFVSSTQMPDETGPTREQTLPLDPALIPLVLRMFYAHQRSLPKASDRICYLANAMALAQLTGDTLSLKFLRFTASYLRAIVGFAINDNVRDIELSDYEEFADSEAFQTRLEVLDMLREYGSGQYSKKLQDAIERYEGSNEMLSNLARLIQGTNSLRESLTAPTLNTLKREIVKKLSLETEENVEIDSYGAEYLGMESQTVEFKTSMVFPPDNGMHPNQEMQTYNVMRAICGFLNSQIGGTVYVGVNDQGYVSGLEADFTYLKCKEFDNYARLHILDRAIKKFGKDVMSYIHIEPQYKGRVAMIRVEPFPFGVVELDGKAFLRIDRETREMTAANRSQVSHQKIRKELEKAGALDKLKQSRFNKRRVVLKDYASSSSGTISDRTVEVYDVMDADGIIQGIDCEARESRIFKVARANRVELTDQPCECAHLFSLMPLDSFLFTGKKRAEINIRLDLCARNMLNEEFPRTASKTSRDSNDSNVWYYNDSIFEGSIGVLSRFCVSMADHLEIFDSPELSAAVKEYKEKLSSLLN